MQGIGGVRVSKALEYAFHALCSASDLVILFNVCVMGSNDGMYYNCVTLCICSNITELS